MPVIEAQYRVYANNKGARCEYICEVDGESLVEKYHHVTTDPHHDIGDAARWAVDEGYVEPDMDGEAITLVVMEARPAVHTQPWLYQVSAVSKPRTVISTPDGTEV